MHELSPKHRTEPPLDLIETPLGDVGAGTVPTLSEALDACQGPSEAEPGPEPLDPEVQQRVYLLAAVLTGMALAAVAGSFIALGMSISG